MPKTIEETTSTQPDWSSEIKKILEEEFNLKEGNTEYLQVTLARLTIEHLIPKLVELTQSIAERSYESGRKEEESSWINQTANEHDSRIRQEAVDTFRKRVVEELQSLNIKDVKEYEERHPDEWFDCCGEGEVTGYNQALSDAQQKINNL